MLTVGLVVKRQTGWGVILHLVAIDQFCKDDFMELKRNLWLKKAVVCDSSMRLVLPVKIQKQPDEELQRSRVGPKKILRL